MEAVYGKLSVKTLDKDFEINNGLVGLRLFLRDGGYAQEFYARDRKGDFHLILSSIYKDLIPSSEHRACASPMVSGERSHLFGVSRESLRMVLSNVKILSHDSSKIVVLLTGSAQNHSISYTLTIEDASNKVHVLVEDKITPARNKPLVEYLMSSYAFLPEGRFTLSERELDYVWAPSLRPASDQVIGDHNFHSPAAIVQKGRYCVSLIPDLDILAENRAMPTALDLDIRNGLLYAPLLSYGFCGYETDEDHYSYHDISMARRLDNNHIKYGYSLTIDARSEPKTAYKATARSLWKSYGIKSFSDNINKRETKEELTSFTPSASDMWSACGLYQLGSKVNDLNLILSAKTIKERLLSAPRSNGLFPSHYDEQRAEWAGCNCQPSGAYYHTAECSRQLYWLLQWYQNIEQDKNIISFARNYADYIISERLRSGAIPSWYSEEGYPIPLLRSSCQSAISALFIAELAKVTGLAKYTKAAEQSARFILKEIIPGRLYQDYTLINVSKQYSLECADPHTGAPPQSALAMLWTAQLFLALYKLTQNKRYITYGLQAIDQLCLLQSVWKKPWDKDNDFGLIASGNTGVRFEPELSAEAARCLMDYGTITGEREYCERAAAAMSAAQMRTSSAVSGARVAASANAFASEFGCAYVHVGKKWGVAVTDMQIRQMVFGSGTISMKIDTQANGNGNRIIFGGMRGNSYKLRINGESFIYSRAEMEAGIKAASNKPDFTPASPSPTPKRNQQSLFETA